MAQNTNTSNYYIGSNEAFWDIFKPLRKFPNHEKFAFRSKRF